MNSNIESLMKISIDNFDLQKAFELSEILKIETRGLLTSEAICQKTAQVFHNTFIDINGECEFSLCRVFKSCNQDELPEDIKAYIKNTNDDLERFENTKFLTLMGSFGEKDAWCDRRQSHSHKVISLQNPDVFKKLPMMSALFDQIGFEFSNSVKSNDSILLDKDDQEFGTFLVENAPGNSLIPQQENFVVPFKILSVLGLGGMFSNGNIFSLILFSKKHISKEQANIFNCLGPSLKFTQVEKELKRQIFTENPLDDEFEGNMEITIAKDKNNAIRGELLRVKNALALTVDRLGFIGYGVQHAADAAFWIRLEDASFVYVNKMACESLGYTDKELLTLSVFDIDPDYQQDSWPNFQQALKEKHSLTFETFHKKKTGELFPVEVTVHLARFHEEDYSIAFARDITERKKTEESLRFSEERFRQLAENTEDVFWMEDLKGKEIIYISPSFDRIWGVSREQLILNPQLWMDSIHPEDKSKIADLSLYENRQYLIAGKHKTEFRIICPDGTVRWILDRAFPVFNGKKELVRIAGISQDITERKCAEEQLKEAHEKLEIRIEERTRELKEANKKLGQEIIERKRVEDNLRRSEERFDRAVMGSTDGLWDWMDVEKGDHWWSPRFYELLGYENNEFEVTFSKFFSFLHPEDKERVEEAVRLHLEDRFRYDIEYRLKTKSGKYRWFRARGLATWDASGKAKRMSGSIQDITERKLMQDDLYRHKQHLQELVDSRTAELTFAKEVSENANKAKSDFMARMSHELHTPMNAILGFSQLLEMEGQDSLTDIQRENMGRISSAGRHLLALINEVLDLSRIESGNMDLSIEVVDMVPIVKNVLSITKSLADKNNITLECQKVPFSSCLINVDPLRFKQIVLNLVSNAIKYNKPNGSVIISCDQQNSDMMRLEVRDTGHGIPDEKKNKLFKPFERFDLDAEKIEGTGIGLAISKQLVELMGGGIGFESVYGEGSFFYIDLPLSNKEPLVLQAEGESTKKEASKVGSVKKKILYIEDIFANVVLVKQILNSIRPDMELISASEALAGIEMAQAEAPDLILMDIHMPGMDGLTAFKKLQTINATQGIPVIALTADAMDSDVKKALAMGFNNYITKPIDIQSFLRTIDEALK